MSTSNKPQTTNPPSVPIPPPTYNQVSTVPLNSQSRLITLAGQTGLQRNGTISSSFTEQVSQAYTNLHACLLSAGATPRDIVHVRHYIVTQTGHAELDSLDVVDRGWGDLWIDFMDREGEGHRPPDTVLGVAGLAKGAYMYEVEAWAVIHS